MGAAFISSLKHCVSTSAPFGLPSGSFGSNRDSVELPSSMATVTLWEVDCMVTTFSALFCIKSDWEQVVFFLATDLVTCGCCVSRRLDDDGSFLSFSFLVFFLGMATLVVVKLSLTFSAGGNFEFCIRPKVSSGVVSRV